MSDIGTKEYDWLVEYLQDGTIIETGYTLNSEINLTLGLIDGTRIELIPPNFTLIFKQRFDSVCGEVLLTFLACTHCVAIPSTVSPTRFTSANRKQKLNITPDICRV